MKKSRLFILIFLGIVIWIQSPVKVLDSQENIINHDATEPVTDKNIIFIHEANPVPKEDIVEKSAPKYKTMTKPTDKVKIVIKARFRCDGRKHCSQMHSCEEAKFFIQNCPGTLMDGDGDGIPCERQHCGRR